MLEASAHQLPRFTNLLKRIRLVPHEKEAYAGPSEEECSLYPRPRLARSDSSAVPASKRRPGGRIGGKANADPPAANDEQQLRCDKVGVRTLWKFSLKGSPYVVELSISREWIGLGFGGKPSTKTEVVMYEAVDPAGRGGEAGTTPGRERGGLAGLVVGSDGGEGGIDWEKAPLRKLAEGVLALQDAMYDVPVDDFTGRWA